MIRIIYKSSIALLLLASIGLNTFLVYSIFNTKPKHELPWWSDVEYEILKKAQKEIIDSGDETIGMYPYSIETSSEGVTIKYRTLDFLQLITSPVATGTIFDGCAYYRFSNEMKLTGHTYCG